MDITTNRALTDFRQYIKSDILYSDLKFPLCSEIATVEVVIPNGLEQKWFLATTWLLYQAEIHLILRPPLSLVTSSPVTKGCCKTQCRLHCNGYHLSRKPKIWIFDDFQA